jgi:hypothetical protein
MNINLIEFNNIIFLKHCLYILKEMKVLSSRKMEACEK